MNLSKEATDNWNHFYDKLKHFREINGHCNVPPDGEENKELVEWMSIQKKAKHLLPSQLVDKLEAINFDFSTNNTYDWYDQFEALERFFGKFGHAHVPATDPQYASLHEWLIKQIRNSDALNEDQKNKLDSLGVSWGFKTLREWKWHEMYLQLKKYYKEHGDCNVPQKFSANPKLSHWVSVQRRRFAERKMRKERKEKLDAMGFVWDFRDVYENQWEEKFDQLVEFKNKYGHCKVPVTYANKQLAGWVDRQRTLKIKGRLPECREKKLDEIEFIWDCSVLLEENWQEKFKQLKQYKKQYGDCMVPVNWKKNRSLGIWVSTQRTLEKKDKLDPEKKTKLNALGFVWAHDAWKLQLEKYDQLWEKNYYKLKEYKKKYGDIQVSVSIDRRLERWTCIQRKHKQIGKLSSEKIKKLEQIGFAWDIHESYWMKMYDQLLYFRKKYGHSRVPWRWRENPQLGQWVSRTRLKQYKLTDQQIALLDKINFDWHVVHKNPVPWMDMFQQLVEFKKNFGHTRVPLKWERNRKLGKWTSRMRSDREKLDRSRKSLLNEIKFDWQAKRGRVRKS